MATRKVEGKFSKKFGFWNPPKLGFGRKPQNKPHGIFEPFKEPQKVRKTPDFLSKSGVFMCLGNTLDATQFSRTGSEKIIYFHHHRPPQLLQSDL